MSLTPTGYSSGVDGDPGGVGMRVELKDIHGEVMLGADGVPVDHRHSWEPVKKDRETLGGGRASDCVREEGGCPPLLADIGESRHLELVRYVQLETLGRQHQLYHS